VAKTTRPFFIAAAGERNVLRALAISLAIALGFEGGAPAAEQGGYVHGVFVGTPHGPIELTAYAEVISNGQLRMAKGSLENVPTLTDIQRILCNVPNWHAGGIFVATQEIFRDERAERREVPFATRKLNISAVELRVEDLERKERLTDLVRGVRASDTAPAYVFIVLATNGLSRFYPFRVRLD
jgi:hypothetical protein